MPPPQLVERYEEILLRVADHRGVFTDQTVANEEGRRLSAELWNEMSAVRGRAGAIGTQFSDEILKSSDQLVLRIINLVKRADLEEELARLTKEEDRKERLFRFHQELARRALDIAERSTTESPTLLQLRRAARALRNVAGERATLPETPLVNGSTFATMIQWVTSYLVQVPCRHFMFPYAPSHAQPFKIATKNTRTALILFFMAKTALTLPEFADGAPLGNVSLEGKAASSKSFHFGVVTATHLPGATMNIAHISQQAFNGSANNSNAIIFQHEAPIDQFLDPHDASTKGGRKSDSGADVRLSPSLPPCLTAEFSRRRRA